MTLSTQQRKDLATIKGGADIYAYGLAGRLRTLEQSHPSLLRITKSMMYRGNGADQMPYFGAILTAEGKKAIGRAKTGALT